MGSHNFWFDPIHRRPIPAALLEAIIEYFGLTGLERFAVNPVPEHEPLSFGEIPFVQQLNKQLYGPQDYGLLCRR